MLCLFMEGIMVIYTVSKYAMIIRWFMNEDKGLVLNTDSALRTDTMYEVMEGWFCFNTLQQT